MDRFKQLLMQAIKHNFSDIHLTGGHPVVFRRNGVIDFLKDVKWSHEEIDTLAEQLLSRRDLQMLRANQAVDIGRSVNQVRIRVNVFNTSRGLSLAIRLLPGLIPEIASLNLHPSLQEFAHQEHGLFLICGSTGSGKSTTMAAMIEEVNRTRSTHIITLEDPIEYRFKSKSSFVEQRELGTHFPTFERGLYDVLREDPDVILVGELRDPETIRLTLNAVESGHMVIASLHATNSEDAIYRIANSFASEAQDIVRLQLASTLAALVVQRLVYLPRVGFRVPILSIMVGTTNTKGLIRDNRLAQLESAIQTGRKDGMITMEQYKQEFIESRPRFTQPLENFKPTAESTSEAIYSSRLMSDQPPDLRPPTPVTGVKTMTSVPFSPRTSAFSTTGTVSQTLSATTIKTSLDAGLTLNPGKDQHMDSSPIYEIAEESTIQEMIEEIWKRQGN